MENLTFRVVCFGHAGDVIYMRPFIRTLISAYPEVNVVLECIEKYNYLWADFGLPLMALKDFETEGGGETVTWQLAPGEYLFNFYYSGREDIYPYLRMSYSSLIHTYNAYLKEFGLYGRYRLYDRQDFPLCGFPKQNHIPHARPRAVLVENGPVFSNQSDMDLNAHLPKLAEMFPGLNFYCSATPDCAVGNVFDCGALNLIELSELSNSCLAFLTRASGVNAATVTEQNRYKPRCFAGVTGDFPKFWRWAPPQNPVVYTVNEQGLIDFLSYVNQNSSVLPLHIKAMEANPAAYAPQLKEYVSNPSFCKILKSRAEVYECKEYLDACMLPHHMQECKDWDIAHVLSDLSDGNLLDMGSTDSDILMGALHKGITGELYGIDFREPDRPLPMINYLVGDLCEGVTLPDGYFQNITCLSVIEHEVNIEKFAREVSRLLKTGGQLYVTFDYWNPKIETDYKPYDLDWNIFCKDDALRLIEVCKANGLALTEEVNWEQGGPVIVPGYFSPSAGVSYTFGMLRFKKVA